VTGCGFNGAKQVCPLFFCDFKRFFEELPVIGFFFFEYRRFLSFDPGNQRGQRANRLGYLLRRKSYRAGYEHHVQTSDAAFARPGPAGRHAQDKQNGHSQKRGETAGNSDIGYPAGFSERPFHQPLKRRLKFFHLFVLGFLYFPM
jgi:hypothetical protein